MGKHRQYYLDSIKVNLRPKKSSRLQKNIYITRLDSPMRYERSMKEHRNAQSLTFLITIYEQNLTIPLWLPYELTMHANQHFLFFLQTDFLEINKRIARQGKSI